MFALKCSARCRVFSLEYSLVIRLSSSFSFQTNLRCTDRMHVRNSLASGAIESDAINIHPPRYIYPFVIFEPYTIPRKRAERYPSAEISFGSFETPSNTRREGKLYRRARTRLSIGRYYYFLFNIFSTLAHENYY